MKKFLAVLLLAGLLAPAFAQPSFADWDHDRHERDGFRGEHEWRERGDWHGGFHRGYDRDYWRAGHWWRGWHEGRLGWWWLANGGWFYYPRPVYPYPAVYAPPPVVVATPPGSYGYYGPWSPVP
jgi:hypothetical protein